MSEGNEWKSEESGLERMTRKPLCYISQHDLSSWHLHSLRPFSSTGTLPL